MLFKPLLQVLGLDKQTMQQKYNISDEVWEFQEKDFEVAQALDGLHNYDIKSVVDNWDEDLMAKMMGGSKRAAEVLHKLEMWLEELEEHPQEHTQRADSVQVTSTMNLAKPQQSS